MGFVSASEYYSAPITSGEIGRYVGFSVALSHGKHKRALLGYRLARVNVRVMRPRKPLRPSKKPQRRVSYRSQ